MSSHIKPNYSDRSLRSINRCQDKCLTSNKEARAIKARWDKTKSEYLFRIVYPNLNGTGAMNVSLVLLQVVLARKYFATLVADEFFRDKPALLSPRPVSNLNVSTHVSLLCCGMIAARAVDRLDMCLHMLPVTCQLQYSQLTSVGVTCLKRPFCGKLSSQS